MICDPLTDDALWLLSAHLSTSLHSLCVDTGFSGSIVMASSGLCCLVVLFSPTYSSPRTFALVLFCLVLILERGFLCIAMAVLELLYTRPVSNSRDPLPLHIFKVCTTTPHSLVAFK